MTALDLARTAYSGLAAPVRTARSVEYDLIARITRRLRAAARLRDGDFPEFAAALHENVKLWTLLAQDVASADNALPDDLKARLIYLYEFTMHHSRQSLAEGADIDVLIDINTAVLRGLREGSEA